ncbi:hypothetical protein Hanom_Chr13g01221251 [Helianthus anomalus]
MIQTPNQRLLELFEETQFNFIQYLIFSCDFEANRSTRSIRSMISVSKFKFHQALKKFEEIGSDLCKNFLNCIFMI